jgi:hypothetical protein
VCFFFFFEMEHLYSIKTRLDRQSPDGLQNSGSSLSILYGLRELYLHPKLLIHRKEYVS